MYSASFEEPRCVCRVLNRHPEQGAQIITLFNPSYPFPTHRPGRKADFSSSSSSSSSSSHHSHPSILPLLFLLLLRLSRPRRLLLHLLYRAVARLDFAAIGCDLFVRARRRGLVGQSALRNAGDDDDEINVHVHVYVYARYMRGASTGRGGREEDAACAR